VGLRDKLGRVVVIVGRNWIVASDVMDPVLMESTGVLLSRLVLVECIDGYPG
jgi:hypothetical protein